MSCCLEVTAAVIIMNGPDLDFMKNVTALSESAGAK